MSSANGSWKVLLVQLGLVSTLAGAFALALGSLWLGAQLTLNPKAVPWLQPHLPDLDLELAAESYAPQTIAQIRQSLSAEGLSTGEPIALLHPNSDRAVSAPALLVPILKAQPHCSGEPCTAIVQLRLYQPDTADATTYHLQRELMLEGLPESQVIAPLVEGNPSLTASNRPLPFTGLEPFRGLTPRSGLWFTLVGEYPLGNTTVRYGQVLHFNPGRLFLALSQRWSSPNGALPEWQHFTGGGEPELVVDRTIGLEPRYDIYHITSRHFILDPLQLEPISLVEPALDVEIYREALLLARSGLWSAAQARLKPLVGQASWSPQAQAQLDTIALHAERIQVQADASWASPGQATIAALLDGRWSQALRQLEATDTWTRDIFPAIAGDPVRLWRRVETSLRFLPEEQSARIWAAIVMAARYDRDRARQWVVENSGAIDATERATIDRLLGQLDQPAATAASWNSQGWNSQGHGEPTNRLD